MYDLVNDVDAYPGYMKGCVAAKVLSRDENSLTGNLTLSKGGMEHSFTTLNRMEPGRRIDMELIEGPFRSFNAQWIFEPLSDQACKVSLDMDFELNVGLFSFALEGMFTSTAQGQIDSIVKQADKLYG